MAGTLQENLAVRDREKEYNLRLTEDEAIALLDIVLVSPVELTPEQRAIVMKVSDFCRQILREQKGTCGARPHVQVVSSGVFAA
jgi:hypothetical protein